MTQREINAGYTAVRAYVDRTGYGLHISDQICQEVARAVLEAVQTAWEIERGNNGVAAR